MPVLFFDQTQICLVCGKRREWCICRKPVKPCACNTYLCIGGGKPDCPVCGGRGWVDKTEQQDSNSD